ncbi:uncharacterized protein KY384_007042 [Bacidia gigantensis]|uniref:uncharacterized protein n=1 Tax=Bacidia gigantensis TaxID=2732470 RepID=UPI001D03CB26|nr:uncharacterized protein KY384_007042 [Bacidia gigantensis]KAG8528126.1 hypothetical protein KY384_007042 [Bacidia gigantensis]
MDPDDQERQTLADEADRETIKLWRAWRTVHEMCRDRGYELSDDELLIPLDKFRADYSDASGAIDRKKMTTTFKPTDAMLRKYTVPATSKQPDPQPQIGTIWIEFHQDSNIGIKQMRLFAQHVDKHNFYTGMLVTQSSITASALKIVPAVLPIIIETFQESDLLVNITRHELVPKHVLLSPEEKQKLLERYRLKESQLPRIQTGDPVSKYLGLRRGQVVKIIRKSETAGRYASYRWTI